MTKARNLIKDADRIFFLVFGYDKENLHLLNIPGILRLSEDIYGTAKGLTPKEIGDIKDIFPSNVRTHIEDTDCLSLLRKYL